MSRLAPMFRQSVSAAAREPREILLGGGMIGIQFERPPQMPGGFVGESGLSQGASEIVVGVGGTGPDDDDAT